MTEAKIATERMYCCSTPQIKWWQKIPCWFNRHDWRVNFYRAFGNMSGIGENKMPYQCKRCGENY